MTHEREQGRDHAAADGHATEHDEPGRATRTSMLQRRAAPEPSGLIQRKARDDNGVADGAGDAVAAASSSHGAPLPSLLLRKFEGSLGANLSRVRVHTGGDSATAAEAVGAKAYTVGQSIHFGAGHYDPSSAAGEHLLAHEVAHTVQQAGGTPTTQYKLAVSSPGDALEHEADRAADAMVAGSPASAIASSGLMRSVQRAATSSVKPGETVKDLDPKRKAAQEATPPDADVRWADIGGPVLVLMVQTDIEQWKTFRQAPASGLHLPGRMAAAQIRKFDGLGAFPGWMRERASAELGPAGLTALSEMRAMNNELWALEVANVFNIKALTVDHHYSITASGTGASGLANVIVHYTNSLKWSWSKKIQVALFGVTIKPKAGKPLDPGRFTLEGSFEQDAPPSLYCGWEDFSGKVAVAKGPTGKFKIPGVGVKIQTGLGVTFQGKLAPITFNSFQISASAEPGAWDGFDKEIELGTIAGGAAMQTDDPATVDTAEISSKPHLVGAHRQIRALIREFETGKAELPPSATGAFDGLVDAIRKLKKEVDPSAKALKKNGLDPAENFQLKVTVEGWASVRWKGAANADDRRRKNLELSEHRAAVVHDQLAGRLAPWNHVMQIVPMGAGIRDSADGEVVYQPEETALAKVTELEKKLHDKDAEIAAAEKKGAANLDQLQLQRSLIASELDYYKDKADPKGKESNEETLRMVKVVVVWDGKLADMGAPSD